MLYQLGGHACCTLSLIIPWLTLAACVLSISCMSILLVYGLKAWLNYWMTCLPVQQEGMSSCSGGRHAFLFSKKTCLLVEDMSSCRVGGHVFSSNKKACLLFSKKACLLVQPEGMPSCSTGGHARRHEDTSSCSARRHVFVLNMST